MRIERTIEGVRAAVRAARDGGKRIAFVPTMGFLHDGHLSLVEMAKERADFVAVSIFVNPKQFGPTEDLATYPRDEERDRVALAARAVDLLFAPETPESLYPSGFCTTVSVAGVAEPLEGERRPGHFDGVATIVLKLLNIVQPDLAIFGQKDAQQCAVVRRLVQDLDIPVEIAVGETVREEDGLALSSRNSYLRAGERPRALLLGRALEAGRSRLEEGGSVEQAEAAMLRTLGDATDTHVDYLRVVDPATFQAPVDPDRDLLVVGAIRVGKTRLIDNLKIPRSASVEREETLADRIGTRSGRFYGAGSWTTAGGEGGPGVSDPSDPVQD